MELHIRDVSKTYPNGVQALKDVTLTIPAGMYGLLGPNSAGKSTLMRMIATLQEPDTGTIALGDIDVVRQKDEVRKTLGYLPQEFAVYPKVNAEHLLDHSSVLEGIAERRARKEVVEALLRQTNLWEVREQKLGGYSGGMRQRFGVATALLGNPQLMIVDEPTAGLDPAERVRFLNLQPGESLQLSFEVHFEPHGFRNNGVDPFVVANGTYFTNQAWLPAIGFQPNRELSNAGDRRAHGLNPRPAIPSLYDIEARQHRAGAERIAFDAVVGTNEDQTAIGPGVLRRTWTEGGRRYFHYSTDAPIGNEYAFFSADYAVHEGQWNPSTGSGQVVAIQIFHSRGTPRTWTEWSEAYGLR